LSSRLSLFFILVGIFSVPIFAYDVFGHGGGGDTAPPVSFQGRDVTVSTTFDPKDITVGEVDKATITLRFFDVTTDENINDVTYRVELYRGDDLLARNLFYDADGDLKVDIKPIYDCSEIDLWRCTKYYGEIHPIAGGYYTFGTGNPQIKGPIFDKGGLYYLKVDIVGATSPQTLLADPLFFELFVSIAEEFNFEIPKAQAESIPVVIKTYYDDVSNFQFKNSDNSISFDMPFNWDPNYVSQVQVVHEEIKVPKSFSPYSAESTFNGYVDGVQVDSRVIIVDPYSDKDNNIIHFMVSGNELKRINDVLGPSHYDKSTMLFKLVPQGETQKNSLEIKSDSGAIVKIAWESSFGGGDVIPFEFTFFDENGVLLKDIRYGYSLFEQSGMELISNMGTDQNNPGIMAMEGINTQQIIIPSQDPYRIQVAIFGQGINYDQTYAGLAEGILELGPGGIQPPKQEIITQEISIPDWVKNNAGWWSEGKISDEDFASGIEYMINEGIIQVPITERQEGTESVIPDWVKNNAGWWSEGLISDEDFAGGLQYLIANGIISV